MNDGEKPPTDSAAPGAGTAPPLLAPVAPPPEAPTADEGPLTAAARAQFKSGDWRIPRTEPLIKEDVQRFYASLEEQLEEMLNSGVIDAKERNRRRSVVRRAGRGSMLQRCHECKVVWGSDGSCPRCGNHADPAASADGYRGACMWKLDGEGYRRLFAAFATDILRIGGEAKSAPARRAEGKVPSLDEALDSMFGSPPDPQAEAAQLAEREELIAAWRDPKWARPMIAEELAWRLGELEIAIRRLWESKTINIEDRDRRIEAARTWLRAPSLGLCGCGYCHVQQVCPVCDAPLADAVADAERHAAPRGRASWSESPAVYQMLLAELWWDLTRNDEIEPLACRSPPRPRRTRKNESLPSGVGIFEDSGESPLADFPPELLPFWEPSAAQRAAARGLGIVE